MNGLDLFSGIGGISAALRPWVRPIAYCECDPYCQGVLLSRMRSGDLDSAPIWDDVRTLQPEMLPSVDIIYGGFPCQPYSSAARGRNHADTTAEEFERIIGRVRPKWVFTENTALRAIERIGNYCESLGYQFQILGSKASDVGAPFIGKRYWGIAKTNGDSKPILPIYEEVAVLPSSANSIWTDATAESFRVADGVPNRVDRLRGLGNAVVPRQAREAFMRLSGLGAA